MRTTEIKFNLNDNIKFKLTEVGKDIIAKKFEKKPATAPEPDPSGFYQMQAWDFISVFGSRFVFGLPAPMEPEVVLVKREEI